MLGCLGKLVCVLLHQDHKSSLSVKGSHGDKKMDRHETRGLGWGPLAHFSAWAQPWGPGSQTFLDHCFGLPAWCCQLPRVVSLVLPMAFSQDAHFSITRQDIPRSRQGLSEAEGWWLVFEHDVHVRGDTWGVGSSQGHSEFWKWEQKLGMFYLYGKVTF